MGAVSPEAATLGVHIAAGVVALLAGAVALASAKGGNRHVRAGKVYVSSMAVVVLSVLPLFAFEPDSFLRQFLLLVAVFSGYFVVSGYRVLDRKGATADAGAPDRYAAWLVALACLALASWGAVTVATGDAFGVVMVVFGVLGLAVGVADLRAFRGDGRGGPWLMHHLGRMIGGYIATVTAVSVVNLSGMLPVVSWLWPTAVGVPLIWYFQGMYGDRGPLAAHVSR